MNDKAVMVLMQLYSLKKKRLHREINNFRLEYQRHQQNNRRALSYRNRFILCLLMLVNASININRRCIWSYMKNSRWWLEIVPSMTNQQFKENFRLNRTTFYELLRQIGPHLQKDDTTFRPAVPVDKKVACALYLIGSTCELRTAANLFGIGKSTAGQILHEFCSALVDTFFHRFIKFPSTSNEINDTIKDFYTRCGYPMCIGSLDGTHIATKPPTGFETDYFNYKKYHSVIMLAVVNSSLLFTYVNVDAPGRCNDSSVYSRSTLADVIQMPIYADHYITINNIKIQSHLIADSAFALKPTVIKPYADRPNISRAHRLFNYRLSRCRCSVERAFGILKNRFRCLHKKFDYKLDHVCTIIKAVTILHNMCIISNDQMELEWDIPQKIYKKPPCNTQAAGAAGIREALTSFFEQNPV